MNRKLVIIIIICCCLLLLGLLFIIIIVIVITIVVILLYLLFLRTAAQIAKLISFALMRWLVVYIRLIKFQRHLTIFMKLEHKRTVTNCAQH